ncbi:MAG: flagellar basal-body rod protein FlgG [Phycisphaerales bacterium]|nr:flagellar basal-body rod protein FlgG [Phycisphaerales bacterium]
MAIMSLHSAASALSALNTSLDVTANNLANVNTPGFKPSRVNFEDLLYVERAQPGIESAYGQTRPIGLYVGLGTRVTGTQTEFTQGNPIPTGNEFDLMIDGRHSFFKVESPKSPGGFAYTRAGGFVKNKDGQLVLANNIGQKLIPEIVLPPDAMQVTIDASGKVSYTTSASSTANELTRLTLTNFINPAGLKSLGGNLYEETAASGQPLDGNPGDDNFGTIQQGSIEASTVDPTKELIDLIKTQRAFEMNSNTIRTADATLQTVAQLKR